MRTVRLLGCVLTLVLLVGGLLCAEPLTYSGKVVDAAGNPVADARITATAYTAKGFAPVELRTDAAGAFSFQAETPPRGVGPYGTVCLATKPGLAMAVGELIAGTPRTIVLGDKPEVRCGVILQADGQPCAGATVFGQYVTIGGGTRPPVSQSFGGKTTTDAQGRFQFEGFAAGMVAAAIAQVDGCADLWIEMRDTAPVTATLAPEATISGKLLVNGQPQAGLGVSAYSYGPGRRIPPGNTQTAADGTYTIRRLGAGTVTVMVSTPPNMARCPEKSVTLRPGQAVTGIDFAFSPGALIRGTVTDEKTGRPAAQASVGVMTAEGRTGGYAQTDAEGKYEARVQPGTYRMNASLRNGPGFMITGGGRPMFPGSIEVTVKEGDVLEGKDLTVRLPRTVKGQVLLPDGTPATAAQITLFNAPGDRVQMQPEGRFELTVPDNAGPTPPADFGGRNNAILLLATEAKLNLAALYTKDPLPDEFTITLQPAATLTLVITDQENHPLSGYGVTVGYPWGDRGHISQGTVPSDALGLIRLPCLPANVGLSIYPDQTLRQLMLTPEALSGDITLRPGEERTLPPLVVNPNGRSLNVFVGDADGKPTKGAQVYAPGVDTPGLTGADGKVTLTKLPLKGKVLLVAAHPTQEWYAAESVDPDAGVWPGLILKPLGKATGTLIAQNGGQPLGGLRVRCQNNGELWSLGQDLQQRLGRWLYSQQPAKTDAQGRWHAEGLLAGLEYHVRAVRDDGRGFGGPANSFKAEGGDAEQDVGAMQCDVPAGQ